MTLDELMENGNYLPPRLRDFHDQKDLFKSLWMQYPTRLNEKDKYLGKVDWVAAQVFTIDIFLWFMAQHGYTLQKARHKCDFYDLDKTIEAKMKEWKAPFEKMLSDMCAKNKEAQP
jgi:hypothetical protein